MSMFLLVRNKMSAQHALPAENVIVLGMSGESGIESAAIAVGTTGTNCQHPPLLAAVAWHRC